MKKHKKDKRKEPKKQNKKDNKNPTPQIFYYIFYSFLGLLLISSFFPSALWGVNVLSFYSNGVRFLFFGFTALLLLYNFRNWILKFIDNIARGFKRIQPQVIKYIIIAVLFLMVFGLIWHYPVWSLSRDSGNTPTVAISPTSGFSLAAVNRQSIRLG